MQQECDGRAEVKLKEHGWMAKYLSKRLAMLTKLCGHFTLIIHPVQYASSLKKWPNT